MVNRVIDGIPPLNNKTKPSRLCSLPVVPPHANLDLKKAALEKATKILRAAGTSQQLARNCLREKS